MRNQGIAKIDEIEPASGKAEGRPAFVKKAPNPIDRHVGSRVRMRRILLGMSQEKLGEALDLTFQQVQKYEKGTNRIGASRLQQISKILNVTPGFFFDGAPALDGATAGESVHAEFAEDDEGSSYIVDFLSTTEGVRLNKAFARIHNPKVRKRIIDLVTSLADENDADEDVAAETPAK
jgi:transcriptional regulator with XRE-family HTH domain